MSTGVRFAAVTLVVLLGCGGCDSSGTENGGVQSGGATTSTPKPGPEPTFAPVTDEIAVSLSAQQAQDLQREVQKCLDKHDPLAPEAEACIKRITVIGRLPLERFQCRTGDRRVCLLIRPVPGNAKVAEVTFGQDEDSRAFCANRKASLCRGVAVKAGTARELGRKAPKGSSRSSSAPTPSGTATDRTPPDGTEPPESQPPRTTESDQVPAADQQTSGP